MQFLHVPDHFCCLLIRSLLLLIIFLTRAILRHSISWQLDYHHPFNFSTTYSTVMHSPLQITEKTNGSLILWAYHQKLQLIRIRCPFVATRFWTELAALAITTDSFTPSSPPSRYLATHIKIWHKAKAESANPNWINAHPYYQLECLYTSIQTSIYR